MTITLVDPVRLLSDTVDPARVTVLDAGLSTTLQDLGRPGFAHLGVTVSGAVDRTSLTLANRLVGNADGATAFENTFGGLAITVSTDRYVAVTGATVDIHIDGRAPTEGRRTLLRAGQVLTLGRPVTGLRAYLAVEGGIETEKVFGSAATDCLSGLGPVRVRTGSEFALGTAIHIPPHNVPLELTPPRLPVGAVEVSFRWGPRETIFTARDRAALTATPWTVSADCDRVGARLTGPPLSIGSVDLPSEGMALGAIQIPPSGEPIVFLADHPVTGGYPVIGVVTERDVDLLAQAAPGIRIRFTPLRNEDH
ncbi:biotin-dependent carboxyltransferase family protein [Rhodococcus sp. JS3073]|uniref:5-oxoprolinase subunit C family protein n=1 Tax=Rhodococcus sp. JS3073 TaxID=3002901 RepID=UPI002285F40D|nr:biotin-dependent carboxyltransferase family protein [Rhodococcus sp. JS3073]WAM19876.1 biotin-dependent carboxyltransferase family protein [Rhodococcus sp. JS3073]